MKKNILIIICLFLGIAGFATEQDSINRFDKKGRKQGYWEKIEDSVVRYKGHFINDRPMGTFTYFDRKGNISAILEYSRDGYAAKADIYFPDTANVIMAKGFYLDREKDSIWFFYDKKGRLIKEEHYKNNLLQGLAILYNKSGEVIETQEWHRGMRNGKWMQETDRGKQQTTYLLNLSQGPYDAWYPDGTKFIKGQYHNGTKEGKWFFYTKEGILAKVDSFAGNRLEKREVAVYVNKTPVMINIDSIAYVFWQDTLSSKLVIITKNGQEIDISRSMQEFSETIGVDFFFFPNKQYFVRYDEVASLKIISAEAAELTLKTKAPKIICVGEAIQTLKSATNMKKVGE